MAGTTMKELERRIGLPQGCDPSAASSAGMARADVMLQPPEHTQIPTRPRLTYCGPILVLTKGSTLRRLVAVQYLREQNGVVGNHDIRNQASALVANRDIQVCVPDQFLSPADLRER